jgi:hemoglobin
MIESNNTPYDLLGGAEGLRTLVNQFYVNMAECEEAESIRQMHQADTTVVAEKLYEYLSGWLGGPSLYKYKYKTVCITRPHAQYVIGVKQREEWLYCFYKAMDDVGVPAQVREILKQPLYRIADFLRNS